MDYGLIDPDHFYRHLFSSRAAWNGAVVRRQVRHVERYVGRTNYLDKTKRRGFPVIENDGQFVVFCNREPIRRLT